MRAVIQRVTEAHVKISGQIVSEIGPGLLVLLAAGQQDCEKDVEWMANKIPKLRIFSDPQGKMNLSLEDIKGEMIVVSQFTLFGDCRKGRRPSFVQALEPTRAEQLYNLFTDKMSASGIKCGRGKFGADMKVTLTNDGPVTLLIDSSVSQRSGVTGFSS